MNKYQSTLMAMAVATALSTSGIAMAGGVLLPPPSDKVHTSKGIVHLTYKEVADFQSSNTDLNRDNSSVLNKYININGTVDVDGQIDVDSAASSLVQDEQEIVDNTVTNLYSINGSTVGPDVGSNASGNFALNVTSGSNNVQANGVSISQTNGLGTWGHATAAIAIDQSTVWNDTNNDGTTNDASLDGAFSDAKGNIAVNVSSGTNNAQKNDLSITASSAELSEGTVKMRQDSWNNVTTNLNVTNTASLGGGAFNGAAGSVAVNVSAGTGNLQSNALAIASN